jgi:hypothetical protein
MLGKGWSTIVSGQVPGDVRLHVQVAGQIRVDGCRTEGRTCRRAPEGDAVLLGHCYWERGSEDGKEDNSLRLRLGGTMLFAARCTFRRAAGVKLLRVAKTVGR